jgi:hypothetical protein
MKFGPMGVGFAMDESVCRFRRRGAGVCAGKAKRPVSQVIVQIGGRFCDTIARRLKGCGASDGASRRVLE